MKRFALTLLVASLAVLALAGCTNEEKSRAALESAGFTEITFDGYAFMACSEDDAYKTKFTARNPQGNMVSGVVCCGRFKGCTVRF